LPAIDWETSVDFDDSPDEAAFRVRFRAWLADNNPGLPASSTDDEYWAKQAEWHCSLFDAGFFAPIFAYKAMAAGGVKKIFDSYQAWGTQYAFSFVVARTDYVKKSPDAVKGFLEDYVALMNYVYKPEARETVIDLVATHFKVPKPVLQQFYLTKKDVYRRLDGRIAPEELQHAVTRLHELGFLDKDLPVAQYVDTSYLPR